MTSSKWQVSRMHYGFGLGILIAILTHLPTPKAVYAYALAGALTALRFRTLGWKPSRAFIPFGVAAGGVMLVALLGAQTKAGTSVAHIWRTVALIVQGGMIVRAVISSAPADPISPKHALARDFLAKRKQMKQSLAGFRPAIDAHREATETLNELRAKLAEDIKAHGGRHSPERAELMRRVAEQTALIKAGTEQLTAETEKLKSQTGAFKHAAQAWQNRNKAA